MGWLATLARIRRPYVSARSAPRRLVAAAMSLAALLTVGGCGAGKTSSSTGGTMSHPTHAARTAPSTAVRARPVRLTYRPLFSLPAPLRDPASAAIGRERFALIGGLDAGDTSTAAIEVASLQGPEHSFQLPVAQHDAQAAAIGRQVYIFGGGSLSELNHILSFDPSTGAVRGVGVLPRAQSDVAVARLDTTAYVVGGYDGTNWLNTILAWHPGSAVRVAGRLPVGLRYSAVAAADGRLLIIGGSTPSRASDAIYSFDPATGSVRRIGRLPRPITHGSAATLGSTVYLVGGRGDLLDAQTATVWAIDPQSGAVRVAGRLPRALSDAGVLTVDNAVVVAGGLDAAGGTLATVGELVPAAAG
jgi:hypothetical protein